MDHHSYDPTPRPEVNFEAYVKRLTCKTCAGVGSLTTKIHLVTIDGREIAPKKMTVRRCEPCNGWGVEGAGKTGR